MEPKLFEFANCRADDQGPGGSSHVSTSQSSEEVTALQLRVTMLEQELQRAKALRREDEATEERIWQVVDSALHAVVLVDRQGTIRKMNSHAEKLFGYTTCELVGKTVEELIPQESRELHTRCRADYFVKPMVQPMGTGRDLYGRRKDGSEVPVEIGLSPVATAHELMVICSILDISLRKRAEERFRLVVDSSPIAIVMVNRTGEIMRVNPQAEMMFGYERSEMVGQPIEALVPDAFKSPGGSGRQRVLSESVAPPMGHESGVRGRRKDGTEFPAELRLTPFDGDKGHYVLSTIVDITERVQADKQRRLYSNELAHVARLSAVGEMFSELAHEINQPLGAAANYTRACVRMLSTGETVQPVQLRDWLDKASAQAVRATEIVQRIAAFVRRGGPTQTSLDVNEVIENVLALPVLETQSGGAVQRVTPTKRLAKGLPGVMADRVQIEQVLLNLLRNSMDAMVSVMPDERRITVETAREGNFVRVSVEDNGTGITPEVVNQIFAPFFTTKANGMGLGLSISKSIVEAHSGTLTVESMPMRGARFSFTLPVFSLKEQ